MKFSAKERKLINPLDQFKDNLVTAHDYTPDGQQMQQMVERMKVNFAYDIFPNMNGVRASVYVFSEEELKSLLYSLTYEKGGDTL